MAGIRDTSERYYSRLPGVGRPGPWIDYAACKDKTDRLFFPGSATVAAYAKGKLICAECCVREECLEDSLRRKEPDGLWGGMAPWERQALLRIRARQRATQTTPA